MASIKLSIQSKSMKASIYLRLSISKGFYIKRKTGLHIDAKYWNSTSGFPKQNNSYNKNLTKELKNLSNTILKDLNHSISNAVEINGDWLEYRIDLFFKRAQIVNGESNLLIDRIQKIIDTAAKRKNGKGEIGLSLSRIKAYKNLKLVVEDFQKVNRVTLKIKDINLSFVNKFIQYMQSLNYGNGNTQKKISDIKTVCLDAQVNGIETSPQLKNVTGKKVKKEFIHFLTESELKRIENTNFNKEALQNAKKWLLLGSMIGQRGADLLNFDESNIITRSGFKLIELKQQKDKKKVCIPFSYQMEVLLENGFPYKISSQKFNKHIKEVCKIAKIDTIIEGYKYDSDTKRKVLGKYKKWELLSSNDLRRSFASNMYGKMPTFLIMSITGHVTEKSFHEYIGKTTLDYEQQTTEYYLKVARNEKKEFKPMNPNLKLLKERTDERRQKMKDFNHMFNPAKIED